MAQAAKTYQGMRDRNGMTMVQVNGQPLLLGPSLRLRNHSPSGFAWGYVGSGPAQLALALLLDYYGDAQIAEDLHQPFKWYATARFEQNGWTLSGTQIETIVAQIRAERAAGAVSHTHDEPMGALERDDA